MDFDIIINETYKLRDNKIYMPSRPAIPSNEERIEYNEIPGRDGSVSHSDGYKDREFPIDFNAYDESNVNNKMREINPIFINAKTIRFTDDPNIFYKVKQMRVADKERPFPTLYNFTVDTTLEPFDYLLSGTHKITAVNGDVIENQGTYMSTPIITVYGMGEVNISIGAYSFYIKNLNGSATINSEILKCYRGTENIGTQVKGSFPIFDVGSSKIKLPGNVTHLEIIPNWRYV